MRDRLIGRMPSPADLVATVCRRSEFGTLRWLMVLGVALLVGGCGTKSRVAADPEIAAAVQLRQHSFSELDTLYKSLGNAIRKGEPLQDNPAVQSAVAQLVSYAADLPQWFASGTGPESGADTDAKAEIWLEHADFDRKAEALRVESGRLLQIHAQGSAAAFGEQLEAVGVACKSCHKKYRVDDGV